MPHESKEPPQGALDHLLKVCLKEAVTSRETRDSLRALSVYLSSELDLLEGGKGAPHGVLTPAARGKVARSVLPEDKALTDGLETVLKRTTWKAAACRVSVERHGLSRLAGGERETAEAQLAHRERVLREALTGLRDTIPWMLDQPFGLRANQDGAFDVPDESAAKLAVVADCYDTLAMAVEKARELEDAGIFHEGPPRPFLYLLAEAQSALLASISEAPVRSDTDQRDVFLWLKEQTTRFRIYVDRHMRLDDLAECHQSADLRERITKLSDELVRDRKDRRQRGQLLSKVRYHVEKLLVEGGATRSEADSLQVALKGWVGAGLDRSDRALTEALQGLREKVHEVEEDVAEVIRGILRPVRAPEPSSHKADGDDRSSRSLDEVRELVAGKRAVLMAPPSNQVDAEALASELGASQIDLLEVDVDGPKAARSEALERALADEGARLFLLGVRLEPEEYNGFKESCLERKLAFVRLPGPLSATAIAHQVMRQVGWRLRSELEETAS